MLKRLFISFALGSFIAAAQAEDESQALAARKAAAIERGLDWLASIQKENGAWSNESFPALTALPLRTFVRGRKQGREEVISRAEEFVLKHVQDDGGIYRKSLIPGRGGLTTFNTAICMTALFELDEKKHLRRIQNARKFLASSQLSGDEDAGGFGYSGPGFFASADMINTSYALEAMKITEKVEDLRPEGEKRVELNKQQAIKFLESLQNREGTDDDEGGFFYKPGKSAAGTRKGKDGKVVFRSYGTMTYLGLLSMMYADLGRDDHRVRSALDWAQKHWTLEENPGLGKQGMFFFYHVMTRALAASSVNVIQRVDGDGDVEWKADVAEKILSLQRDNGSWVNENGRYWEADPVLVTSYSILALQLM